MFVHIEYLMTTFKFTSLAGLVSKGGLGNLLF